MVLLACKEIYLRIASLSQVIIHLNASHVLLDICLIIKPTLAPYLVLYFASVAHHKLSV